MKRGLTLTLMIVAITLLCVSGYAYAPIIGNIPDVWIGDAEDNEGTTLDLNFFRLTGADLDFYFEAYVERHPEEDDQSTSNVRWSFYTETDLEPIQDVLQVNGKMRLPDPADSINPGAYEISGWPAKTEGVPSYIDMRDLVDSPLTGTPPFPDPVSGSELNEIVTIYASNGIKADSTQIVVRANLVDGIDKLSGAAWIDVQNYPDPALSWTQMFPESFEGNTIEDPQGDFNIADMVVDGDSVGVICANDSTSYYGGWQTNETDVPYVADNLYKLIYTLRTTQTDTDAVPQCRLAADFTDGSAGMAANGGLFVTGRAPFSLTTTPQDYNMYIGPQNLPAAIQYLQAKFEVIDFNPAESGTNYMDQLDIKRMPLADMGSGTPVASWSSFGDWTGIAFTTPFGNATTGLDSTGVSIQTPMDSVFNDDPNRVVDYGSWSLAGADSGVSFEADKLYRAVFTLQAPTATDHDNMARARMIAKNNGNSWIAEYLIDPGAAYRDQMPQTGGTEYSVWLESTPSLYGGTEDGFEFIFDIADGSDAQGGTCYMTSVELLSFDIP